jgi:hypothetical protein
MKRRARRFHLAVLLASAMGVVIPVSGADAATRAQQSIDTMSRLATAFDQALRIATNAAEQQITTLEARAAIPVAPTSLVDDLLYEMAGQVCVACDAATERLDYVMASVNELSPIARFSLLCCIDRHVSDARRDLQRAIDYREHASPSVADLAQVEVSEHRATYARLLEVRALVAG